MTTAVIISRFQSPYLDKGHRQLIDTVQAKHNKTVVILGISPITGSRNNPYDYYTREKLIEVEYKNLVILPLKDDPSDITWQQNLDTLLDSTFPGDHFKLYGSSDNFIPFYKGKYETVELQEHSDYNSTELRAQYVDKVFESKDFREGILYAVHNQYSKVYPTVDVAVFRNDRTEILLGMKEVNKKWRFIGGYADPEDDCFETSAKRELMEEAGQLEVSKMRYETSRKINDWRYKSEVDKIITTLFSCDHMFGTPKAQDDIIKLDWFKIADLPKMIENGVTSPEHKELFEYIIREYNIVNEGWIKINTKFD